ncbi:MAG: hypothetical protein LBB47_01130 [Spirochaetaceae bacterium]|nr:hypothetical protein [Spirochaetaceae bacterium]
MNTLVSSGLRTRPAGGGVFRRMWQEGLLTYDKLKGVGEYPDTIGNTGFPVRSSYSGRECLRKG